MRSLLASLIFIGAGLLAPLADAQTYLGVLTVPANQGPGGSCCSLVATVDVSNAAVPQDGSCPSCSVITLTQYNAYLAAAQSPGITTRAVQQKTGAGITLACSTTPALSGTYAVNVAVMTELNTIIGYYVANGNSFPAAAGQVTVQDTTGALHTFPTLAAFQAFYKIVAWYWVQLIDAQQRIIAGQAVSFPSATSTAC